VDYAGVVTFNGTPGIPGDVSELHLISGNPVLAPAAMKAVKQWKYSPTLLNGVPVEIKTQVDVSFNLSQ
jgi:outer membrane biosynthesis protein TonB